MLISLVQNSREHTVLAVGSPAGLISVFYRGTTILRYKPVYDAFEPVRQMVHRVNPRRAGVADACLPFNPDLSGVLP
jgi:hypothetical protein